MNRLDVFQDIAVRTSGDVFIGVVGPVRSGKSTFIKRFMDVLVLPRIDDPAVRERTIDELPQSGVGRTVMTTEPKFVPDEAVAIEIREGLTIRVRLADSVGFPVEGALGYDEDEGPRMVHTPWFEEAVAFETAAEVGTRKIIADHSTLAVIVTTDGSIGELPRAAYEPAEARTVEAAQALGKPFVILLNTRNPEDAAVLELAEQLADRYESPVLPINAGRLDEDTLLTILQELLYEFPVAELDIRMPQWVEELDDDHWLRRHYEQAVEDSVHDIRKLRDVDSAAERLSAQDHISGAEITNLDLGAGSVSIEVSVDDSLFWRIAEEISGFQITGKEVLLRLLRDLAQAKRAYDKLGDALQAVDREGYAIVPPTLADMNFQEPEMIRKGNQFGVRLRATAPSLHLLRADISAEVTPIIGTEKQSEQLVNYLLEKFADDPSKIWESDIFGQPLSELLREGVHNKLYQLPDNARTRLRDTLERIINEGSGGLICIIL